MPLPNSGLLSDRRVIEAGEQRPALRAFSLENREWDVDLYAGMGIAPTGQPQGKVTQEMAPWNPEYTQLKAGLAAEWRRFP